MCQSACFFRVCSLFVFRDITKHLMTHVTTSYCLVTEIIKKYSNFVGFPIYLDGTCINTIQVFINLFVLDV